MRASLISFGLALTTVLPSGCARDYPAVTLSELPSLEPDGVMAFRGELFVPTGRGLQRLVGDELRAEMSDLEPALEDLHDTGEHLWFTRRDTRMGWGSPETIFQRDERGEWAQLPLTGLLVASAVTRGDDAWIVSVDGLGSDDESRRVLFVHEGIQDDVTVPGDLMQLFAASDGIYLAAHTYRAGSELFVWSGRGFAAMPTPARWSDDPMLMLVNGRLHVVDQHQLFDVVSGLALPPAPPIQADDPWNPGLFYRGNEHVVLTQDWSVFTGSYYFGAGMRTDAQIDRLVDRSWLAVASLEWSPQSAFWLADETLVVCNSTACFRALPTAE